MTGGRTRILLKHVRVSSSDESSLRWTRRVRSRPCVGHDIETSPSFSARRLRPRLVPSTPSAPGTESRRASSPLPSRGGIRPRRGRPRQSARAREIEPGRVRVPYTVRPLARVHTRCGASSRRPGIGRPRVFSSRRMTVRRETVSRLSTHNGAPHFCAPHFCAPHFCAPHFCAPHFCAPLTSAPLVRYSSTFLGGPTRFPSPSLPRDATSALARTSVRADDCSTARNRSDNRRIFTSTRSRDSRTAARIIFVWRRRLARSIWSVRSARRTTSCVFFSRAADLTAARSMRLRISRRVDAKSHADAGESAVDGIVDAGADVSRADVSRAVDAGADASGEGVAPPRASRSPPSYERFSSSSA